MEIIYLDHNATTRPDDRVVAAMVEMLTERWHNPSSIHRPGQDARRRVELARASVARLINARPRQVVLTSGATEAIACAVRGTLIASPPGKRTVVTSAIEHEAMRDLCEAVAREMEGAQVRTLPMAREGIVDADALNDLIDDSVAIVSVMWANNETGAIQPIARLGETCRARGVVLHTDATQWVGKMPTDVTTDPVDLVSLSAHKFHGPKGAGALYIGPRARVRPIIHGAQEQHRRGGTENTPGIVGLGIAADLALEWLADPANAARVAARRDRLERGLLERIPGAIVNGAHDKGDRLWNTTNISFPPLESEAILLLLSERGVCASAGSACASGSLEPSPVLTAMGIPPERAHGAVRFSLSRETTDAEVDRVLEIVPACIERLRASMPAVR